MTSFLLMLQSNLSVLKERSRSELSSHIPAGCGVGILTLHWQQCSAICACPSVAQLCVTATCSCVVVSVGLLPRHVEIEFFRWVNSKLSLPPLKVLWSAVLWHLSVSRCRSVSLAKYILSPSFHTQLVCMVYMSFKCLCYTCVILSGIFCPIIFIAGRIEVKCFHVARLYLCKRFWCSWGHSVNTEIG